MAYPSSKKTIAEKTIANPGGRVSLRDIAREVGVSHVTVLLALRKDSRVSEERRMEIEKVAARMGYRPDPMLSALAIYSQGKKPLAIRSTLAWLNQWPEAKQLRAFKEFDAYWHGAREAAEELGYRLEEMVLGKDMTGPRLQKILITRNTRGILLPPHQRGFSLQDFDWNQFSVVKFGSSIKNLRAHIVTADQMTCAMMAFERIRERGYSRIGYVTTGQFERNTRGNFGAGYLAAQETAVPYKKHLPVLELDEDGALHGNVAKTRAWLKSAKPDAILTTVAFLPDVLKQLKYRVPGDMSVATLSMLDGHFDAGMDQNSNEVGRVAVSTLAGMIQQNQRGLPEFRRRILVEGKWIDGSSLPDRRT
jgi:DNA-binding LacI/PurR family transcriptional regulator